MDEKELKELERLAKAAIERNPQESEDILEQAILERKDELWRVIQKKARRQLRARKTRPWIASAAVVLLAAMISGAIGVNQARAGKDGLLVDIVEGVAGRITFSEEPVAFLPITLEEGTWDDIMANIDPVMIPLLPEGLPEEHMFQSGTIEQPSPTDIQMSLTYYDRVADTIKTIFYMYKGNDNELFQDPGIEKYTRRQWDGTDVHMMVNGDMINIAWQQDACLIEIWGLVDEDEGRMWFDAIKKEP